MRIFNLRYAVPRSVPLLRYPYGWCWPSLRPSVREPDPPEPPTCAARDDGEWTHRRQTRPSTMALAPRLRLAPSACGHDEVHFANAQGLKERISARGDGDAHRYLGASFSNTLHASARGTAGGRRTGADAQIDRPGRGRGPRSRVQGPPERVSTGVCATTAPGRLQSALRPSVFALPAIAFIRSFPQDFRG